MCQWALALRSIDSFLPSQNWRIIDEMDVLYEK